MPNPQLKPFPCSHCGAVLGSRSGDSMIGERFEVPLKHRQRIVCINCGRYTVFPVDKKTIIDKKPQKIFN